MENVIGTIVFLVLMAGIIGLVVYKVKKSDSDNGMTAEEFIHTYYDNLIDVLKDSVKILSVDVSDYPDRASYLKAIISLAIEELNNNCEGFGIDTTLFELFDKDVLTEVLYGILTRNNIFIFKENVPIESMNSNPALYTAEESSAISEHNATA